MQGRRQKQYLRQMQTLYEEGDSDMKPETVTFNSVLQAFSVSRYPDAAEKCQSILDQMQNLYSAGNTSVKPDSWTYNIVMNAWSKQKRTLCRREMRSDNTTNEGGSE